MGFGANYGTCVCIYSFAVRRACANEMESRMTFPMTLGLVGLVVFAGGARGNRWVPALIGIALMIAAGKMM